VTREEWYAHYRALRSRRPKRELKSADVIRALNELYGCMMTPEGDAFCHLVERYRAKIGAKHLARAEEFRAEGRRRASEYIRNLISRPNPFLEFLKKNR